MTRPLLGVLLVALALLALVGVYSFVVGDFSNWWEIRVLATCATTAYCSLTGLSCAAALERSGRKVFPLFGIIASVGAFLLLVLGIWTDFLEHDVFWKPTAILAMIAAGTAHTCVLSFARLKGRFAWARFATGAAVLALVLVLSTMVITEEDDEIYWRCIGALCVLISAGTLTIPVFHRLSALAGAAAADAPCPEEIELICPRCHRRQKLFLGSAHCQACELPIHVQLDWPTTVETS